VARTGAQLQAGLNAPLAGNEAGLSVYLPLDSIAADGSTPLGNGGGTGQAVNSFGALNGVIAGTLATPGQTDTYQFTIAERTQVLADSLVNAYGVVSWRLTGPGGLNIVRNLSATDASDAYPVLDLLPGTYTLSFDASNDDTAPYALRLLPLSALPALTPGVDITGTLAPGSRTDGWRFQGQAGATYFFDAKAFGSTDGRVRLVSPYGTEIWSTAPGNDIDTFTLPVSGDYTLLVEGRRGNTCPAPTASTCVRSSTRRRRWSSARASPSHPPGRGAATGWDSTARSGCRPPPMRR
jgi:hypothetical protein